MDPTCEVDVCVLRALTSKLYDAGFTLVRFFIFREPSVIDSNSQCKGTWSSAINAHFAARNIALPWAVSARNSVGVGIVGTFDENVR